MKISGFVLVGLAFAAVAMCGCGLSYDAERGAEIMESPNVHPEIWPEITSPVGLDPEIESRIDDLLEVMTIEDKVGQIVQGEIRNLSPEDVRKYRLGSVLNGGGVQPYGKHFATVEDWLDIHAEGLINAGSWNSDPEIAQWMNTCRLNGFSGVLSSIASPFE